MSSIFCLTWQVAYGRLPGMSEKTIAEQMREWGALGGKARAKKYTKREISLMAKRAVKRMRANGKRIGRR